MKAQKVFIFICLFTLILTYSNGCKKNTMENTKLESLAKNGVEKANAPQGCEIISNPADFTPVIEDQGYHFETDYSSFETTYGLADAGETMFCLESSHLFYYDYKKNKFDLLCSKPDCSHIMEDALTCNAYIDGFGLTYFAGALYTIEREKMELIKITLDGSEHNVVGKMCSIPEENIQTRDASYWATWIVHRGYIYYIYELYSGMTEDVYYLNGSNCIYRMPLDGTGEPECVLPLVCESNPYYTNLEGYGSYVYMNLTEKEKESGYLYRYNIESGKVEKLEMLGNDVVGYTVRENKIYYSNGSKPEEIYCYDETTGINQLFLRIAEGDHDYLSNIHSDKDYIYVVYDEEEKNNNWGGMSVFDWQGNKIVDIPWTYQRGESFIYDYFCGTDGERLYFQRLQSGTNPWIPVGNAYKTAYYIEKADLEDGDYEIHEGVK